MEQETKEDLAKFFNELLSNSYGQQLHQSSLQNDFAVLQKSSNQAVEPKDESFAPDDNFAIIVFPESFTADIERFLTTVDSAKVLFEKYDYGFVFLAKKTDIEAYIKKYQKPNHVADGKIKQMEIQPVPKILIDSIFSIYQDIHNIFKNVALQDKIKFMYLICSSNIIENHVFANQSGFDKIVQNTVLKKLENIQKLPDDESKNEQIKNIAQFFVMSPSLWNNTIDLVHKGFGTIKFSNPLSLITVLSDGTRANLFELDSTKTHHIVYSVDVSKINQETDFSNLIIDGNFICRSAKKPIKLPRVINGNLDLSQYKFISDLKRIPDGVQGVDLSHTVKSFSDLNNLEFPETITEILVAKSMINKVLKDLNELEQFNIFFKKHPKVIIWDDNHKSSLQELLYKDKQQKAKEKSGKNKSQETVDKPKSKKTVLSEKTPDWLNRKEIVDILSKDERFTEIDSLERLIKRAMKLTNVPTSDKKSLGQSVSCVHVDNIEFITQSVLQIIAEDEQRNQHTQRKAEEKKQTVIKPTEPTKTQPTQDKPAVLQIKKYIPKNVWKDICDSCNDSLQLKISVLEEISKINLDYTKQYTRSAPVQYIDKNGCLTNSKIHKKDGNTAVQDVGTRRKHIVWTINPSDKILVAIAFLEEHAESTKAVNNYVTARTFAAKCQNTDGVTVTRNLIKQGEYFNVSDLLKELQKKEKVTETSPVIETPDVQEQPDPVVEPTPVVKKTSRLVSVSPEHSLTKKCSLVDLKAKEAEMKAMTLLLDGEIKIDGLLAEFHKNKNDPQEQLELLRQIRNLIDVKKFLMGKYNISIK